MQLVLLTERAAAEAAAAAMEVGLYKSNPADPHSLKAPSDPTLEPMK
jgi:hypothetical protein